MLNNYDLSMTIEHVEKGNPNLKVYLQKQALKKNRTSKITKIRFKSRCVKCESKECEKRINIKHSKFWIRFIIKGSKNILIIIGSKNS